MTADAVSASAAVPPHSIIDVSLSAIAGNLAEVRRRLAPAKKVIAIIKGDGYGHGVAEVAAALADADYLAVGSFADAARVRQAGIAAPLLLLGTLLPEDVPQALGLGLIPSIDSIEMADCLARAAPAPIAAFVKVDCGFRRFGVPLESATAVIRHAAALPALRIEGIYTHLPFADPPGRAWAEARHAAFVAMLDALAAEGLTFPVTQGLASPALSCGMNDPCSAVAIGTLLFGLPPVGEALADAADLGGFRPAVQAIRTTLVQVGPRRADPAAAAYPLGAVAVTGVVPVGIVHGYGARLGPSAMIVAGRRVPVLRVCMESTILDLSAIAAPRRGSEAVIMGRQGDASITLAELAAWHGTGAVTTLIRLGAGLPRRYRDRDAAQRLRVAAAVA